MFFSKNNIEFRIIDVFKIDQKNSHKYGKNRNFSCVSFRSRTNGIILSENEAIEMQDGTVSYFPNNVDYERIAESEAMIAIDLEIQNYTSDRIEYYVTKNFDKLNALFNHLYKAWISPGTNRRYKANSILYEILSVCNAECCTEETAYKSYFTDALKYIHRNYGDSNLNITSITKTVSTNETYLRKEFQKTLGVSPKHYINQLRIKKAKSMLKSGYYSVKETADACGFPDEKYFSTVFLKYEGCSPSHYKLK